MKHKYLGRGVHISEEFEEFTITEGDNTLVLKSDTASFLVEYLLMFARCYPKFKLNNWLQDIDMTKVIIE